MEKVLYNYFRDIEKIIVDIKVITDENRTLLSIFEDEYETDNPIVINNLKNKELHLEKYHFLINKVKELIELGKQPISIKCNNFIENFHNTQEALDYINKKIEKEIILEGTRELFTGLAYTSTMSSSSPLNIYYIQYKFPQIFGFDIELSFC